MKLIGTKPNETADETIIRCANNLVKAVLASGRSIHSTSGVSGVSVWKIFSPIEKAILLLKTFCLDGKCGAKRH